MVGETSRYDSGDESYLESLWRIGPDGRSRALFGPAKAVRGARAEAGQPLVHRSARAAPPSDWSAAPPTTARSVRRRSTMSPWGPGASSWFRQDDAVRVVSPQGRVRVAASGLAAENYGIAVSPAGKLFVAEGARRRILAVAPDGARSVATRSAAPWFPTGVALGSGGTLHVLEATDYRRGVATKVRVRRVDGRRSQVLATGG